MYLHRVHKKVNVFPLVNLLLEFYHGELLDLFRFRLATGEEGGAQSW